ncbi:F0F1 ATP synthase subunit alpha, partial [Candidatus Microgenomates bacterium]|nr:F0F1 ATP synthase subunit alpha [Candidatus Microgenomates bacterium]
GLSVSRVGGAAQTKKLKTVAGPLRLELAQYRELAVFSQFGSDLDQATREKLERGARLTEILKQPQFSPLTEMELVLILYIATKGFLDDIEVFRCRQFEEEFLQFMQDSQEKLLVKIDNADAMSSEIEKDLQKAITHFKNKIWQI